MREAVVYENNTYHCDVKESRKISGRCGGLCDGNEM